MFKWRKLDERIKKSCETHSLNLSDLALTTVPKVVVGLTNLKTIDLRNNALTSIDCSKLPSGCDTLILDNNKLETLDLSNAPSTLRMVYANNNKIQRVVTYNSSIVNLFVDNNIIKTFDPFSDNIRQVSCKSNKIFQFQNLNKVEILHCSENAIEKFVSTPHIRVLWIDNNPLHSLKAISRNTEMIVVDKCNLSDPNNIDSSILFVPNVRGLSSFVTDSLKSIYATKIQKMVRGLITKRKYPQRLLIRDVKQIGQMQPNTDPKLLRVFFNKPISKIAMRSLELHI